MLEPSPPAVQEQPYFADDPTARADVPAGRQIVSPVSTGDILWSDLAAADPNLAKWCAERWLGAYRRLGALPPKFAATRRTLHSIAEDVMKPAREKANGKFGLRYTHGGFGTPFFGDDVQLRVEGTELVEQRGEEESRSPLDVDPESVRCLADWYGFVTSVLEELRTAASADHDPSRVQLWPEHFDVATELGSEAAGQRAGYGGSPGDEDHPEPYLYVVPWTAKPRGELWQATAFTGAELTYADLLKAKNQRTSALDFFSIRLQALTA